MESSILEAHAPQKAINLKPPRSEKKPGGSGDIKK